MSASRPAARPTDGPGGPAAEKAAAPTAKPAAAERAPRERWGAHGWDNAFPSMRALFLIAGPGIRRGRAASTRSATWTSIRSWPNSCNFAPHPAIDGEAGRIRKLISK